MQHVNGGVGDKSYANNSLLQREVISKTWPIAKQVITDLYNHTVPTALTIADLGCSSGSNTLMIISNLINQVEEIRREKPPLEYQIFFNDLHGNDFNAIFRSLPSFLENLMRTQVGVDDLGPCFFNGVPGSFYGRLFPSKSMHFFYSSYSLHWLSQVPEGIENNKGNVFMSATSPKSVLEAYYTQFQNNFSMFLRCRAKELVADGRMVLTMIGRTNKDPFSKECARVWDFLTLALNSMVAEELVEEEKVDSFNIPNYMPSPLEVKIEVSNEGSFVINHFEVSKMDWDVYHTDESNPTSMSVENGYNFANSVRSVIEPLLIGHFGEVIVEELFSRYRKIVIEHMSKERIAFVNFTISLTKIK